MTVKDYRAFYSGKRILVTGGTGSIGSRLVERLLDFNPATIRILSRNEHNQYLAQAKWGNNPALRFLIGDIRDKERLNRACEDIDIIFHTAALKHVPSCEYNPFEAVKTNVIGTQNLIEAALDNEVDRVISINTDKSVNPISTMGATKLLAEKLILAANTYRGLHSTRFVSVRFGNVIDSEGGVLQLFKKQIDAGGPLTITHKDMERFVMTKDQAVTLVLKTGEITEGNEIFILKMPVILIQDLAEDLIEESGENIGIVYIGLRPGEKIREELMTAHELSVAEDHGDMFIIKPGDKQ